MIKQIKVCLGRFQPFTLGHLKMATYKDLKGPDKEQQDKLREQPNLKEIAKQKTIILSILTTKDKVDTRHPFDADLMKDELELLRKNYSSEIEDIMYVKSADICAWGEMLKQKGYQASVWLTGSDEFAMYKGMAIKVPEYEEHNRNNYDCKDAYTKSFYVESIERSDDNDFISSISGTKVRQALLDNDKELFIKMMPKGADKYFDKFKEAVENAPEPNKKLSKKKIIKEGMKSLIDYVNEDVKQETSQGGLFTFGKGNYLSYFNDIITVPTNRSNAIEIETLYVTNKNKGIGTKLVNACIEYAKSINKDIVLYASPLELDASEEQEKNLIKFYNKLGFVKDDKGIDEKCLIYKVKGES